MGNNKTKKNNVSLLGIEEARVRQAFLQLEQQLGRMATTISELERKVRRLERKEV